MKFAYRILSGFALMLASLGVQATETPAQKPEDLRVGTLRVGKVLFLGNSITLHGPAPKIGWTGNWGMAASAQEKDYVHLLIDRITKAAGGKPQVMVKNIADSERRLNDYNLRDELKQELAFEADVIIIALGENASPTKTPEAKAQFRKAFASLLAELKRHGRPTIFVRSQFWQDADKDEIMKQTCEDAGGIFVDISKLGSEESNFARAERPIEHAGVAGHPGDKGMREIADALWLAIQKRAVPTSNREAARENASPVRSGSDIGIWIGVRPGACPRLACRKFPMQWTERRRGQNGLGNRSNFGSPKNDGQSEHLGDSAPGNTPPGDFDVFRLLLDPDGARCPVINRCLEHRTRAAERVKQDTSNGHDVSAPPRRHIVGSGCRMAPGLVRATDRCWQ
jgi:lysophospholipase L1-like esterase